MSNEEKKSIFSMFPNYVSPLGDWEKEELKENIKPKLSINFTSCDLDDKYYNIYFAIESVNLTNSNASIYIDEIDNLSNDEAVPKTNITINKNGTTKHKLLFAKDKNFTEMFFDDGNSFKATITCDGFSAETKEFKLNLVKSEENEECKKTKVPALELTEEEKNKFISTVLCESQLGNEALYEIAWVYYNRVRLYGFDSWNGMKASTAYRLKQLDYKLCCYYFGVGDQYKNDKYFNFTINSYVETREFKELKKPKFLKIKKFIESQVFSKNPQTCFKDWEGQGYYGDLDMNTDDENNKYHDPKWFMARQYYWLQLQNKVRIKFVHIMLCGSGTSFIFDEKKISKFFKSNANLLPDEKNVRKFKINGILNFEL